MDFYREATRKFIITPFDRTQRCKYLLPLGGHNDFDSVLFAQFLAKLLLIMAKFAAWHTFCKRDAGRWCYCCNNDHGLPAQKGTQGIWLTIESLCAKLKNKTVFCCGLAERVSWWAWRFAINIVRFGKTVLKLFIDRNTKALKKLLLLCRKALKLTSLRLMMI